MALTAGSVLDSVVRSTTTQPQLRSKLYQTGRLHKGQTFAAATSTIPSKYKTLVTDNSEQKGFGSRSKRFQHEQNMTEGPAPSHYQTVEEGTKENVSLSKKGTGTFASKVKRFHRSTQHDTAIAPGQYNPLRRPNSDFNKASCTSNFHLPIAVKRDSVSKEATPAPNRYKISNRVTGKVTYENNVAACAAFKSRSRRDVMNMRKTNDQPPPGAYDINDALTRSNPRQAVAPFKSTTERNIGVMKNVFPGPGAYRPFETVQMPDRRKLPRQHYLCLSAPAIPLPPTPPQPGPGHYNLVNYRGEPRKYVSSSVFVSSTRRWTGDANLESFYQPGPATYNPADIGKQSFIYNTESKWI
eukprot:Seg2483.2 transcript_id=Seg2483.2/GoldUCD/mRNA.D3Y31 product="N-alpha-acetyltransferase 35 NatC auxiliary subunit" protein_id=Seg2483.2/GoldUCD/D3Y31